MVLSVMLKEQNAKLNPDGFSTKSSSNQMPAITAGKRRRENKVQKHLGLSSS